MPRFQRLRRVLCVLAVDGHPDVAFPMEGRGRHAEVPISELNSWPVLPSIPDAQHGSITLPAPPAEAEAVGYTFFVGHFHSLSQTGFIPAHPSPLRVGPPPRIPRRPAARVPARKGRVNSHLLLALAT